MARVNLVAFDPQALEEARVRALLTVGELQERAPCSAKSLWLARRGQPVGMAMAKRIARALRVPAKSLLAPPTKDGRSAVRLKTVVDGLLGKGDAA